MARKKKPSGREPLFLRGRDRQDYQRRAGYRQPHKIILILCEGRQTEPNYFRAIRAARRIPGVRVEVVPGGKERVTPIHLVEAVEDQVHRLDWDARQDEAWCVFDMEAAGVQASFQNAVDLARQRSIHLAVSNPAFEYWYLLHFEETDRPFMHASELIAALLPHIPNYAKNMAVFPCLEGFTDLALSRSRRLRERSEHTWENFENPSTGVDQLVEILWTHP